ncbi:ABC transporter permease [Actinomadura parmotrematis]|uniref:ABC transporter permease n=1 Tax=Actinomadura parmotrematis TaxID=2864039 RepID=UPI0027E2693C|nr:ABC transporter permease [Actinomadura parmotrematis]
MQGLFPLGAPLAAVLVLLLLASAVVCWVAELGHARAVLAAGGRAVLQLAVVSLLIGRAVQSLGWTALFIALMYAVASWTARSRLGRASWTWMPIAAGTQPVLWLLLGTGVLPARGVALIPVAGILIGGTMTATVLSGRRCREELRTRAGEVEAALAIGLGTRQAVLEICRPSASGALLPVLDQTRTVGLVTLPGAFVGMLLGGASAAQAAAAQLVVSAGLLAAEAVAIAVTLELVARRPRPA